MMTHSAHEPIPLFDAEATATRAKDDSRARMPEPVPVRLVTVDDAHLPAAVGFEQELDAFYVNLLGLERVEAAEQLIYRAENFRLMFDLAEPPLIRDDFRALGIQVRSLRATEQKIIDLQMEYSRQKGLNPGGESLVLQDPAGNWIEIVQRARLF